MPDRDSFRKSLRVIKWLGYNTLEEHPLARMLHEARASETAREKLLPTSKRRGYQFRPQRVYAAGNEPEEAAAPAAPAEPEGWQNRPSMVSPTRWYDQGDDAPRFAAPTTVGNEVQAEPVDHLFEQRSDELADREGY